jgi:hypothetical protein
MHACGNEAAATAPVSLCCSSLEEGHATLTQHSHPLVTRALQLLLAASCWLLAAGCWPLAAGCWLLAAGRWPLAAGGSLGYSLIQDGSKYFLVDGFPRNTNNLAGWQQAPARVTVLCCAGGCTGLLATDYQMPLHMVGWAEQAMLRCAVLCYAWLDLVGLGWAWLDLAGLG